MLPNKRFFLIIYFIIYLLIFNIYLLIVIVLERMTVGTQFVYFIYYVHKKISYSSI